MDNREIAAILYEIAVFSELAGENPFKARAFSTTARMVEKHGESIEELCAKDMLIGLPGMGKTMTATIQDIVRNGKSGLLETLKSGFPATITDLLSLSGLGPKRVKAIYETLGISTLGELEYACRENRLSALPGFGEKMQANILRSIDFKKNTQESRLCSEALEIADRLIALCKDSGLFSNADIAGSLRRGKAVFKDIDILLVPGKEGTIEEIKQFLVSLADGGPEGNGIIGAGDTKVSIRREGLQVDFRVVPPRSYPAALQHFTGSKEHNTALRTRAKAMGLKMSEYGVFKGDEALALKTESDVYAAVGLSWIPAELREADGEIEAAEADGGGLPSLVEPRDFKGMIHVHSKASDGTRTVRELAQECMKRGYAYLCLSDHSRTASYAGGLSIEALESQAREVEALNAELAPFRIFHGIESDILADGSLDYPDAVLAGLDFVIGSVHSKLVMEKEAATDRLLAAISNPRLTVLGHPSGRLLLSRQGYAYDEDRILSALAERGVVLEHNANPHRLDPDWDVLKRAARRGVLIAIDPDAHDLAGFEDMRYGIVMARKAWLEKKNVLNCMDAEEIDAYFSAKKGKPAADGTPKTRGAKEKGGAKKRRA